MSEPKQYPVGAIPDAAKGTASKSKKKQKWYIGIDFGTSNTYIVGYESNSKRFYAQDFMDGSLTYKDSGIPTVITADRMLDDELKNFTDTFFIGKEALRHPFLKLERQLKDYARAYDPNTKGLDAGDYNHLVNFSNSAEQRSNEIRIKELLKVFFEKVFEPLNRQGLNITKDTIARIVIGCPSNNGYKVSEETSVSYDQVLIDAIARSFKVCDREQEDFFVNWSKVKVVPEPELAGLTYLCSDSKEDDVVLVVDSGGGTTDFALLYWQDSEPTSKCIGNQCNIAGNTIDNVIMDMISKSEPITKEQCRVGKEDLFIKIEKDEENNLKSRPKTISELKKVSTQVGDRLIRYNITEDEDNSLAISPNIDNAVYGKIISKLANALEDSQELISKRGGINKILFVGGTSFVSPLRKEITDFAMGAGKNSFAKNFEVITPFDNDIKIKFESEHNGVDINCFNAVAIGACIKAIDKKMAIFPKLEFSWDQKDWELMFSPEKDGILSSILQDTMLCCSFYLPNSYVKMYTALDHGCEFFIRIGDERVAKLVITKEQFNRISNDLVLGFWLSQECELFYSIYDGVYKEKYKDSVPKEYVNVQDKTIINFKE